MGRSFPSKMASHLSDWIEFDERPGGASSKVREFGGAQLSNAHTEKKNTKYGGRRGLPRSVAINSVISMTGALTDRLKAAFAWACFPVAKIGASPHLKCATFDK